MFYIPEILLTGCRRDEGEETVDSKVGLTCRRDEGEETVGFLLLSRLWPYVHDTEQ